MASKGIRCISKSADPVSFNIGDSLVELEGPIWQIVFEDKKVLVREGTWLEKDLESNEFMPDWSLSLFYENSNSPQDYLYFEQSSRDTAIHNFKQILSSKEVTES